VPRHVTENETDGRRLRREQNREAVLDALVALFRAGNYQPGAAEIAERAGLSPRSLFRYFDDVDDLHQAATNRQLQRASTLAQFDTSPEAPTAVKIERVVQARARLFEELGPAARAMRACAHRYPRLARQLRANRSFLRDQLRVAFAPELAGPAAARFPAIDALCSFESYELLRFDQNLSRAKTAAALTAALRVLLDVPGGHDEDPAHAR
jgi:TetR/AcrR family transcriptional regulator, regulator of autoinduction and epiphytic fitness